MNYEQRARLLIILTAAVFFVPAIGNAQQAIETADASCQPVITECGCGQIPNPKGKGCIDGSNRNQCPCSETVNGTVTSGLCVATDKCLATNTGGKSPSQVSSQQLQNADNGGTGSGAVSPSSSASGNTSGGSAIETSADQGLSAPTQSSSGDQSQASTPNPLSGGVLPNAENALSQLSGLESGGPSTSGSGENIVTGPPQDLSSSPTNPQVSTLTSGENALQSGDIGQPTSNNENSGPTGQAEANFQTNPSLSSSPMGNLNITSVGNENSLGNSTPGEIAQQDLSAIGSTIQNDVTSAGQSLGSWVDSTLAPTSPTTADGLPQSISDMRASIYYPGQGGTEGGIYGSQGNYLNPSTPTVAAGYSSGLNYGDVVSVSNPSTGQSVYAVVGDVCPGCGSGVDLTPVTAQSVGLSAQQGVMTAEVGTIASTGSYTGGAQLAGSLNNPVDPWSGASATNVTSLTSPGVLGVASVTDFAQYADFLDTSGEQGITSTGGQASTPINSEAIVTGPPQEQSAEVSPEPLVAETVQNETPNPTTQVTSSELPEPSEPNPTIPVTSEDLSQPVPVTAVETGPDLEQPNPTSPVTNSELPEPSEPNPTTPVTSQELGPIPTNSESPSQSTEASSPVVAANEPVEESSAQAEQQTETLQPQDLTPQERIDDVFGTILQSPDVSTGDMFGINSPELGAGNIDNPYAVSSGLTSGQADANSFSPSLAEGQVGTWADDVMTSALQSTQGLENIAGSWTDDLQSIANSFDSTPSAESGPLATESNDSGGSSEQVEIGSVQPQEPTSEPLQPEVSNVNTSNEGGVPNTPQQGQQDVNTAAGGNPYDNGNQTPVNLTCQGGGGVCGANSTSAAGGGTPLTGSSDGIAVPKNNPYGLQIGDQVQVQVGGTVVQNVPVTDYTPTGSNNYVASGMLDQQLGGNGSNPAIVTPMSSVQSGSSFDESGVISAYSEPSIEAAVPETPSIISAQSSEPISLVEENAGLVEAPPPGDWSAYLAVPDIGTNDILPGSDDAVAITEQAETNAEASVMTGNLLPGTQPWADPYVPTPSAEVFSTGSGESYTQGQPFQAAFDDSTVNPTQNEPFQTAEGQPVSQTPEQQAQVLQDQTLQNMSPEANGTPVDQNSPAPNLAQQQQQDQAQQIANLKSQIASKASVASQGLTALQNATQDNPNKSQISQGLSAANTIAKDAAQVGDQKLAGMTNSFLAAANNMNSAYQAYMNSSGFGSISPGLALQDARNNVVNLGSNIVSYIHSHY